MDEILYSRDLFESATVQPGGVETDVVNFIWQGNNGFITNLGFGIQDPNQWSGAYFSLYLDTMRVPDWSRVADQVGRFDDPTPVIISVARGQRIRVTATNNNLAAALMAARVKVAELA
jgi:hypothetical protein